MKTLEQGQNKIRNICDQLRSETIDPAKEEAERIIAKAREKSDAIILEGEQEAKKLISHAHSNIEQERRVFHSSLQQASKQAMEALRQEIESKLFNDELNTLINKELREPKVIADLINALVKDIEKRGIESDLEVLIPQHISPSAINSQLLAEVQSKLKNKPLEAAQFAGGIQIKLLGKKMTVDLTDKTVKELLSKYIRKDFRHLLYNA